MHIGYSNLQRVIYFVILMKFKLIFPTNSLSPTNHVTNYNVEIEQCKKRSDNDFEVIEVIAGENANIPCNERKNGSQSQLIWFSAKGNEAPMFISLIENSRRYSKINEPNSLHLVILGFTEFDQGCYQCQIFFWNSTGKRGNHTLTKFVKVKQKPIQPPTTMETESVSKMTNPSLPHQSASSFSSIPIQWSNYPETIFSTSMTPTKFYPKEHFPQMPLLFVCIALLTLVDILLACLIIKWCNDSKRRNDPDIESLQNDSLSISTALDGSMLPSPSDYKPFMQPSHISNTAHSAYIVKVPIHSQRINAERRRRYSQDLETIYENFELELSRL